jgi:hypothetical protein
MKERMPYRPLQDARSPSYVVTGVALDRLDSVGGGPGELVEE